MRLYFIRHGQSENNLLWAETGDSIGRSEDPELTDVGHQQAQLLAEYIRRVDSGAQSNGKVQEFKRDYFGIQHLYTSLMIRSVATATYLSDALEIPLKAWPEIHETGGIYLDDKKSGKQLGRPGKPRSYFTQNYNQMILPETVTEEGWWNRPFEREEERPLRAKRVLDTLMEKHPGEEDRVAIVSHGGFYVELARIIFGMMKPRGWFLLNNTGVSRFDFFGDDGVSLVHHNRTDHLPDPLIT